MQKLVARKPIRCGLKGEKDGYRLIDICYFGGDNIGALANAAGQARDCHAILVEDMLSSRRHEASLCSNMGIASGTLPTMPSWVRLSELNAERLPLQPPSVGFSSHLNRRNIYVATAIQALPHK